MKTFTGLLIFIQFFFCVTMAKGNCATIQNEKILSWNQEGIVITLKDYINIPDINWPRTLISYTVDLSSYNNDLNNLLLVNNNSVQAIPFQLVQKECDDNKLIFKLFFTTDLMSGDKKKFTFCTKNKFPDIKTDAKDAGISIKSSSEGSVINNGKIKVEIPKVGVYKELIPSIIKIGNDNNWLGHASMPPGLTLKKLEVSELSVGPLFAHYQLDYQFEGDKGISFKFKLVSGMEFLEIEEDMSGFTQQDSISWDIIWDNFNPEYRFCTNRPGAPIDKKGKGYNNYKWEPINGLEGDPKAMKHPKLPVDQQNLENGKLPFKIAPYHNWMTWWRLPTSTFWSEENNQSVGIFIKDFEKWVDPAYPIWASKDNMSIHFYYNDILEWKFPMIEGKRSTAIALYPHQKDKDEVERINSPQSYVEYLRRWYGWIPLDKTKGWILDYDSDKSQHPAFFQLENNSDIKNPSEILGTLKNNVKSISISTSRGKGPSPVGTRTYYEKIAPLFEKSEGTLSLEDYKQARAWFLFMTYIFMDETLMPVRNMLSGHPNFLADIKGVPGLAAFLFPDHPEAQQMADHYEKSTSLNLRYHIRPNEPAWESTGGRWTENLSCYTWAFLRPTLKTSFLLHHFYDGKNRILHPNISMYGGWLLNSLTSPLDFENGRRIYPPQGAHSRKLTPSNMLFTFGHELYYYDPLLAENIFWLSSPDDHGFENKHGRADSWDEPSRSVQKNPGGTNPRLKSQKFTGYGFNLRSHFAEQNEMYVHLQQIDEGPNYRWGRAAKGGNGVIYYYAEGKQYSHNGVEDVGDAPFGDTERCTNFGVKKEKSYRCFGDYRSVGRNDLTEPLYDFGFAQFASVIANGEASPEYKSRSVLMSDNDYILIFDDVKDNTVEGRLSWFVGKDDSFPYIHQLEPGIKGKDANIKPVDFPYYKDKEELLTKGRYYDGNGDFLTLVTHHDYIQTVKEKDSYKVVKDDRTTDWIFRNDNLINFEDGNLRFKGTAGIISEGEEKDTYQAALFKGYLIGIPGLAMEIKDHNKYAGISIEKKAKNYSGVFQFREETAIKLAIDNKNKKLKFYLNGTLKPLVRIDKNNYKISIPKGKHRWQLTSNGVIPDSPEILSSISGINWCKLNWTPANGSISYIVQKSDDGGGSWSNILEVKDTKCSVTDLPTNSKIHIRIVAKGQGGLGIPSNDYPIYTSSSAPHAPEGLRLIQEDEKIKLNWGQILGADQYTLYQRTKGEANFKKVVSGSDRSALVKMKDQTTIYEFVVTATNGNGESEKSIVVDTDKSRFINWYPKPGEVFRRDCESQENGYFEYNHWIEQEMPVLKYPFQIESK